MGLSFELFVSILQVSRPRTTGKGCKKATFVQSVLLIVSLRVNVSCRTKQKSHTRNRFLEILWEQSLQKNLKEVSKKAENVYKKAIWCVE